MMRNLLTIFFTILFVSALVAQPINKSTPEANLEFADQLFEEQDYYNALDKYELYYEESKDLDVAFKIAVINEQLRDYLRREPRKSHRRSTNSGRRKCRR